MGRPIGIMLHDCLRWSISDARKSCSSLLAASSPLPGMCDVKRLRWLLVRSAYTLHFLLGAQLCFAIVHTALTDSVV